MTSHDLGPLGAEQGKPVFVQWSWFDSKPTLPLWIGLLLLLIVPRENHKWQAWLILIVPLLAAAPRLLYLIPSIDPSANFDALIQVVVTFAIAWAAVWLSAPYLSGGSRLRAILSALMVMFGVGTVGYLAYFGFSFSSDTLGPAICFWSVGCVSLLLALGLSGAGCRETFHPGLIAAWMMLWLPVMTAIGMVVGVTSVNFILEEEMGFALVIQLAVMVLFGSLFVSGGLYVLNLPVLILAGLTDCYGDRLRAMVYRDPFEDDSFVQATPVGGNPFQS